MAPRPSGRRMHLSYLNPGTAFFVARLDGEVVGTCAMIADGPYGLPSDRAFIEENDALRAAGRLFEHGSLAIAREHRRHTRRIMLRLVAAMTRTAIEEHPDSPLVLAVAPENLRFYENLLDAVQVGEARPLYGAPAILLRLAGSRIGLHAANRATPMQRTMDSLIREHDPAWIDDRRAGSAPRAEWLQPLLHECPAFHRLRGQAALLDALTAEVLAPASPARAGVLAA
jgi:hypothetical protein